MRTIHVILATRPRLYRDLLFSQLSREYDVNLVGKVDSEMAIATTLRHLLDDGSFAVDDPVVVITSVEETDEIPGPCSRLLCEFPEITIIAISSETNRIRSFQLRIDVQEVPCSISGLVDAIRECSSHLPPW